MIEITNKEQLKHYYIKEINAYVFDDNIDISIDLTIDSSIYALNINSKKLDVLDINASNISSHEINAAYINAKNINAKIINSTKIDALDINVEYISVSDYIMAWHINAKNIEYGAFCCTYMGICCDTLKKSNNAYPCITREGDIIVAGKIIN